MILLDTTVLMYAVGAEHPMKLPCARILEAHGRGIVEAAVTIEVVQEFVHVFSRRRPRPAAVTLGRAYAEALPLLAPTSDDLDWGLTIFENHPALGAFDAVLAAMAINQRLEALVSADRAFGSVPQLAWLSPDSSACTALLAQ